MGATLSLFCLPIFILYVRISADNMNTYELTYIIPIKTEGEDISSIQAKIDDVLVRNGAKKSSVQNEFTSPQKKKLSYEIDKIQCGYYITLYFDADAEAVEKISKELRMDSGILRFLIISVKGEIPQGVVVSKKEVAQQIDDAVENITKEVNREEGAEFKENPISDKPEPQKAKENGGQESGMEEKKRSAELKQIKKASLENLDEKLNEILGG